MGKITRTWSLMSACWQVLLQEKSLLIFPLLSGICCLMVMASFAIPLFISGAWQPPTHDAGLARQIIYFGTLLAFYFCNYFVVIFFNAATVACAAQRLMGGSPTLGDGLRAAFSRLPVIIGWALVSATVGLILRIIEDRSERIGQFVAGLLGMAWTVASFMVVPILVIENRNPFSALKDSTMLLKQTWGERVVSNVSFGILFFLLAIPVFALIVLGVVSGKPVILAVCIGLAVLCFILLALIQSTLQAIFQTALYLYARNGQAPNGFAPEALSSALG